MKQDNCSPFLFDSLCMLQSTGRTSQEELEYAKFDDYDHRHRIFLDCFYQGNVL